MPLCAVLSYMVRHRPDLIEGSGDNAIYSIQSKVCDYKDKCSVRIPPPEYDGCCEEGEPEISNDIGNVQEHSLRILMLSGRLDSQPPVFTHSQSPSEHEARYVCH